MTTAGPSAELSSDVIEDMGNETVYSISSDQNSQFPSTKPSSFTGRGKNTVSSPDINMGGTNKTVSALDNNIDLTARVITSVLLKESPSNFVEGNNGGSTKNEGNPDGPEKFSSDSLPNVNNCENFDRSAETNLPPGVYGGISENINNNTFSNDEISDSFKSTTTKLPTAVGKDDTSGRNNLQNGVDDNSPPPMNMNNSGMQIVEWKLTKAQQQIHHLDFEQPPLQIVREDGKGWRILNIAVNEWPKNVPFAFT
nr:hypothetical transcript [Hymenolepis microstoma]